MMVKGLVIRTGVPLPPAAGPARVKFLHREGVAAFRRSCRLYGEVLVDVGLDQLGDIGKLPTWVGFENGPLSEADERDSVVGVRLRWQQVRDAVERRGVRTRYPQVEELLANMPNGADWKRIEDTARRALQLAVDAFNFLEDDPLAEFIHIYAHQVAAFVCGMFGCTFLTRSTLSGLSTTKMADAPLAAQANASTKKARPSRSTPKRPSATTCSCTRLAT